MMSQRRCHRRAERSAQSPAPQRVVERQPAPDDRQEQLQREHTGVRWSRLRKERYRHTVLQHQVAERLANQAVVTIGLQNVTLFRLRLRDKEKEDDSTFTRLKSTSCSALEPEMSTRTLILMLIRDRAWLMWLTFSCRTEV